LQSLRSLKDERKNSVQHLYCHYTGRRLYLSHKPLLSPPCLLSVGYVREEGHGGRTTERLPAFVYLSCMSVKTAIQERDGLYFITFTCQGWLPLFENTNSYDLVYQWFDYLKAQGHFICGYVIMPNHLHLLIGLRQANKSLNTLVSNGKRFMAYELVRRLQTQGHGAVLQQLAEAVSPSDARRGKRHQVFEPSFDAKECRHDRFVEQKLQYIHNNPCSGKWSLAPDPISYLHSSAQFYLAGKPGVYEVTNYKTLEDIDLTKR